MKQQDIYLILPGCDDTNRGDQALIWETKRLAEAAGYVGDYYMLADNEHSLQSAEEGILHMPYILEHPSSHFKGHNNIKYTKEIILKWAIASIFDIIRFEPLTHKIFRMVFKKWLSPKKRETLEKFGRAKAAFVKGGGFLHAYGKLSDTYKIYYFLYHIRLALSLGIDVYVMPNSFGPFCAPMTKRLVHNTLSKCKVIMARETISQSLLIRDCGIQSCVFADIAFHLECDNSFNARQTLISKGIPIGSGKCVALTMRPYRFNGVPDAEEKYGNYLKSLRDFIVWLNYHNFYPVIVEHVYCEHDHENDMICIEKIIECLPKEISYSVFSDRTLNARQMKSIYSCFDYIIGTRFHSVIFSISSEVPAIAISYGGNKGIGIMHDIGLSEYCISISEITSSSLICAFENLVANRKIVLGRIRDEMQRIKKQADEIVTLIRNSNYANSNDIYSNL